jgi:hypothetical protein
MVNSRSYSAVQAMAVTASPAKVRGLKPGVLNPSRAVRHRLRAVDPDEVVPLAGIGPVDVTELLPPAATWLPAPQHDVPARAGRPPMVGYLVLVPADQQPPSGAVPGVLHPVAPGAGQAARGAAVARALPVAGAPVVRAGSGAGEAPDGPVLIDTVERVARVEERVLDLTYLEFELLAHLVAHPNRVHSRDQLVTTVWGYGHVGDGRTVDVHVARLRRKLGTEHRDTIRTVRRVGYKYVP